MGDALGEGLLAAAPGVQQYGTGIGAARDRAQRAVESTRAHDLSKTLGMGQLGIRKRLAAIEEGMGPARIAKMESEATEAEARAKVAVESLPSDLKLMATEAGIKTENLAFLVAARPLRLKMLQADLTGKEDANTFAAKIADPKYRMLLQDLEEGGVTLEQLRLLGPAQLKQLGVETSRIEELTRGVEQKRLFDKEMEPLVKEGRRLSNQIAALEKTAKEFDVSPAMLDHMTKQAKSRLAMTDEQINELQERIKVSKLQREQIGMTRAESFFNEMKEAIAAVAETDEQARMWEANYLILPTFALELDKAESRLAMIGELARGYMVPLYIGGSQGGRVPQYTDDVNDPKRLVPGTGLGKEEATALATNQIEAFARNSTNLVEFTMDHFAEKGDTGPLDSATMIYHESVNNAMRAKGDGDMAGAIKILQKGFDDANTAARTVSPKQTMQRFLKRKYTLGANLTRELDDLIDAASAIRAEDEKPLLREQLRFWEKRLKEAFTAGKIPEPTLRRLTRRATDVLGGLGWRQPLFLKQPQ